MRRFLKILFSIPYTIYFNFRYLSISEAIKLPIWLATNVRVKRLHRGCIHLNNERIRLGLIRIGFHEADAVDVYGAHTIIDINKEGVIKFSNDAHIGQGAIILVKKHGSLSVGKNFAISGTSTIICNKEIAIGDDVQLSWNSLITDSDAHIIYSVDNKICNHDEKIAIGNHVWVAANTTILKGSSIGNNNVVASNSLVNRKFNESSCIIGGCPAKILKKIGGFKI